MNTQIEATDTSGSATAPSLTDILNRFRKAAARLSDDDLEDRLISLGFRLEVADLDGAVDVIRQCRSPASLREFCAGQELLAEVDDVVSCAISRPYRINRDANV